MKEDEDMKKRLELIERFKKEYPEVYKRNVEQYNIEIFFSGLFLFIIFFFMFWSLIMGY